MEPCELSASDAAQAIDRGTLTSEALVRSCLARIEARDSEIRAWVWIDREQALRNARDLDKSPRRSRLHGVPIGIKDIFDTADQPTQQNSLIYAGHRPTRDAAAVGVLRAAGLVILGKTDTVEFAASGRVAATRNPHDYERTPGGSSSGSAAAVTDHHVPLALGTQTAGSVIRPASFCGIPAFKPTFGTVSREGVKPYASSLDTVGWFGRGVADLALLAEIFAIDFDATPIRAPAIEGLRVGLCRSPYWPQAAAETRDALERAAVGLAKAGARVVDVELPGDFDGLADATIAIMRGEGRPALLAEYRNALHLLDRSFRDRVENSAGLTARQLADALDLCARLRPVWDEIARGYDVVLTPSALGEAPLGLAATGDALFNRAWTALHGPAVNLPAGRGPHGVPVGVQLVGARYADRALLAAAQTVERVLEH